MQGIRQMWGIIAQAAVRGDEVLRQQQIHLIDLCNHGYNYNLLLQSQPVVPAVQC